jgi:hypothetical protein
VWENALGTPRTIIAVLPTFLYFKSFYTEWNRDSVMPRLRARRSASQIPAGAREFPLLDKVQTGSNFSQSPSHCLLLAFSSGVRLSTHLHLVLRFRRAGAIPLLPLYAFMAFTGTALHLRVLWTNSVDNQLRKFLNSSTHFFGHCTKREVMLAFFFNSL